METGTLFALPAADPKRTAAAGAKASIARFLKLSKEVNGLFTQSQAALLLGVSHTRVNHLIRDGRFRVYKFEHDGEVIAEYVSGLQIESYLTSEDRKPGRPSKARMFAAGLVTK
ncbi:MAG: hypothetical protein JO150_05705 [Acidobacteriaceae bacterium]|nr:hypothetical protein [Acidobacteriaceae bacterium]